MHKRYFDNTFAEYNKQDVVIDATIWQPKIKQLVDVIVKQQINRRTCDGGLYVGLGGVAYALWFISTKLPNSHGLLKEAHKFSQAHLQHCTTKDVSRQPSSRLGFLLGNKGIEAISAVIAKASGDHQLCQDLTIKFHSACKDFLAPDPLGCGSDEMLVGRAGYLSGALWLHRTLGTPVLSEKDLDSLCDVMVDVGRKYSRETCSPCPLMYQYHNTEYLGAGHGLTGILQMILSVPNYFKYNPGAEADVRGSVDYLVSLQMDDGNFPCAMDELGANSRTQDEELVHWCHGAPGVVYLLAKAHLTWGGNAYINSAIQAAECCWKQGLLKKGPGICHGVAGTGYVFLLMYRLTQDKLHLYRATKCAEFLYSPQFQTARTPDCPLSLYEGWAGTACFLTDLLQPEKAAFPFFEVFP